MTWMWNFGFSRVVHCIWTAGQLLQPCLTELKVWEPCPGSYLDPRGSVLLAQVTWAVASSVLFAVVAYHWLPAGEGGWWATSVLSFLSRFFFFFSLWPEEGRTSPASCWQRGNALLSHSLFMYLFILLFIRPQFIQTSILAASLKKVQWNSHFRLRLRYKQLHWCRYQSQNAVFDFWRVLPPRFCFLFS